MPYIRQLAAIAVASGVAVASLAGPAAATNPSSTTTPAAAAAKYLVRNLAGAHHDHYVDVSTYQGKTTKFADAGETADAVLSLDAAGVAQTAAARATKWLEGDAVSYIQAGNPAPDYYPGSVAKLLLVAEAQHVDPEHFGSVDLVSDLVSDEGAAGAAAGQYQNPGDTTYGSSVLNQSLAVLAVANDVSAGSEPSAPAVAFLAGQQCTNGGFENAIRTTLTVDCANADQDVDTTAYAIQALIAANDRAAAVKALTWLTNAEHSDGGWSEQTGSTSDANSTAIAVEALSAAHDGVAKGEAWLTGHQLGCSVVAAKRGAVKSQSTYSAATAVRATSQAGVALAGKPLAWVDKSGATAATPTLSCPSAKK